MGIPESVAIAGSMLFLFVVMSQSAVSLCGRRVPLAGLDRFAVQPHHRNGVNRLLAIALSIVVATGTQGLVAIGLLQPGLGTFPRVTYLVEVVGALIWVSLLAKVAARHVEDDPR